MKSSNDMAGGGHEPLEAIPLGLSIRKLESSSVCQFPTCQYGSVASWSPRGGTFEVTVMWATYVVRSFMVPNRKASWMSLQVCAGDRDAPQFVSCEGGHALPAVLWGVPGDFVESCRRSPVIRRGAAGPAGTIL